MNAIMQHDDYRDTAEHYALMAGELIDKDDYTYAHVQAVATAALAFATLAVAAATANNAPHCSVHCAATGC